MEVRQSTSFLPQLSVVVVVSDSHCIMHFAPVLCFFLLEMKDTFRNLEVVLTSGLFFLQYDFDFLLPCSLMIILSPVFPEHLEFLLSMLNSEQENLSLGQDDPLL